MSDTRQAFWSLVTALIITALLSACAVGCMAYGFMLGVAVERAECGER